MSPVTTDYFVAGELARLDESSALRRVYDAHNLRRLRQLLTLFAAACLGELAYTLASGGAKRLQMTLAIANLLLVVFAGAIGDIVDGGRRFHMRALTDAARTIQRHLRAWTLGFFALQFFLFVLFQCR